MSVMNNPNLSNEKKKKKLGGNPYDTYTTQPYKLGSRQSLKESCKLPATVCQSPRFSSNVSPAPGLLPPTPVGYDLDSITRR